MKARRTRPAPAGDLAWFDADPVRAARQVLMNEVIQLARAGVEDRPALALARAAHGCRLAGQLASDGGTRLHADMETLRHANLAAATSSATIGDVMAKLGLLVISLAAEAEHDIDGEPATRVLLAAGALADLAVLGDRPIPLPRDVAEPILDSDDVARLRARAGRVT